MAGLKTCSYDVGWLSSPEIRDFWRRGTVLLHRARHFGVKTFDEDAVNELLAAVLFRARVPPAVAALGSLCVRHRRFDTPALNERLDPDDVRDVVTRVWDRAGRCASRSARACAGS
jgi:hypothetical protein